MKPSTKPVGWMPITLQLNDSARANAVWLASLGITAVVTKSATIEDAVEQHNRLLAQLNDEMGSRLVRLFSEGSG